ncbi:STOMATAL CYTOKINESIS-DEFECTIVE 1 family protein [Hibiscus syriacus]|uniref:STOMATAL CYTOKINESIS-DEFECTIVE 1 family protein n=1 Tax=Hibiscus syriacus TaxID=106335 RepID=A0A6A3BV42_HIBSY|nr:gastric triacylglycerol lipase-like [Hibiscus syriacus]KAE8720524.1 STOMATAL CYTOKINESIS-DEFECTIVE 1 family protein [Hibiscus syriacus]
MRRFVDNALAVTKESVKTFTYESLNNIARLINGVSALLLAILVGKANSLDGAQGWELRPTFHGPRFPRWMKNGVSSFNQFIHELSVDDTSSVEYLSTEDEPDDGIYPLSPSSHGSRTSKTDIHINHNSHWTDWVAYIFSWILLPARVLLRISLLLFVLLNNQESKASSDTGSPFPRTFHSFRKGHTSKDYVVQRTIDRRRGVIEDLHLAIEIFIEAIFDMFHKATYYVFSPSTTFRIFGKWFSSSSAGDKDIDDDTLNASVSTSTLGANHPAPRERNITIHHALNTDARTCRDVITELGYPYEAIHLITNDGYVILLERIPRRNARKAVFLQHGIMDSSMGWVSNGVVGSPAFAAFDQGYDVFLGNFRGLVSREHVDKNISLGQYWRFSINEHGTEDVPAMIDKIHEVKTAELKLSQPDGEIKDEQPYKLCAISHSMGGAAMLMYVIIRRIEEKPHRLSRLILLSPAGFHDETSFFLTMAHYVCLLLAPILALFVPALYIPTRFFRMLFNKLVRDFHNYPAVGGLVQTILSYGFGGDSSNWVGVLGLPHYNMNDMPGLSFRVVHHLAQIKRTKKFRMYDFGNAAVNMEVYGSPEPIDLGEYYSLIDIPVDLLAGRKDQIISSSMVSKHYRLMKDVGVNVSYNEFEYGHLDFTFAHHEELLAFVMSSLLLMVEPDLKRHSSQRKALKLRKRGQSSPEVSSE